MTANSQHQLWGEMEDSESDRLRLSPSEREFLTKPPRPLTLEGPRIHQPKMDSNAANAIVPKSELPQNPCNLVEGYVTHGIRLLSHISELQRFKEAALARRERGLPPLVESIPPTPSLIPPNTNPVHLGPFSGGRDSVRLLQPRPRASITSSSAADEVPSVNSRVARKALKKAVAAMAAFHGYSQASDNALDVFTDATGQYLEKFCSLLRSARDNELTQGHNCGFADPVCRVYDELGLGSILSVRTYYKKAIVGRHKAITEAVETLVHECNNLDEVPTFTLPMGDNGSIGVDNDNIPEIHFPSSTEEADNGSSGPPTLSLLDHNAPQIETGLQMLQSLEQGGYGNLDSHHANPTGSTPPPASTHSGMGDEDNMQQPMSHDSNAALLLATVSPGSSSGHRKRRKTSDKSFF